METIDEPLNVEKIIAQASPFHLPLSWIVAITSGYTLSSGAIVLWGYWKVFNVDFFQFIQIQDILRLSAHMILPLFTLFSIYFFIVYKIIWAPILKKIFHNRTRLILLPFISILPISNWVLSGSITIGVLTILAFSPSLAIFNFSRISAHAQRQKAGFASICFLLIPIFCFMVGNFRAKAAIQGDTKLTYSIQAVDTSDFTEQHIYIGRMGGFVFLFEKVSNETIALPEGRIQSIKTVVNKNRKHTSLIDWIRNNHRTDN